MPNKEIDKNFRKLFGKTFKEMSKEEREKLLFDTPITLFGKLEQLSIKVNCLVDFINILGELDLEKFKITYNRLHP